MRAFAFAALVSMTACASAPSGPPPLAPEPAPVTTSNAASLVVRGEPRVEVSLASPPRVLYSPSTMRAPRPVVRVIIVNTTGGTLDVANVRVRLEVTREGAVIPCARPAEPERAAREPRTLAPGESETYVRTVDCPLPLAGTYAARVFVAFGREGPWSGEGRSVRDLALTVAAPPDAQPRPIEDVPGLYAGIGAGTEVSPTLDGKGRIFVALVNARNHRISLPPLRLASLVRKVGTEIPCVDEPVRIEAPAFLEPGTSHKTPVALSCLGLGVSGSYDVEARLLVDRPEGPTEHVIGALRITVSTDPARNQRIWK